MPQTNDLIVGIDPTAFSNITGAQLAQLVNSATLQSDRGLAIVTTDTGANPNVPDAITTTKWKRYLWIRQSTTFSSLYVWNENGATDVTYLKWVSVNYSGIGIYSITGGINGKIALNSVTDDNIVSLSYSKVSGVPVGLPPNGAAGGDLTGTYPSPSVAPQAITTANIKLLNITDALVQTADAGATSTTGITVSKLRANANAGDMIKSNGDCTFSLYTPNSIVTGLANANVDGTDNGKILAVDSGAAKSYKYLFVGAGRVIQSALYTNAVAQNQNTTVMSGDTAAQLTTNQQVMNINGGNSSVSITPLVATSKIRVRFSACVNTVGNQAWIGLYDGSAFVALARVGGSNGTYTITTDTGVHLEYQSAAVGDLTPRVYSIHMGSTDATAAHATMNLLATTSSIVLEEIAA